ncbi:MAG: 30S ribosomal protein S11 [Candidatus Niyogibacteria bacterium CG10_big_fil_rev_8_21_14_0_10_42_19]|uniref:Small ribosomal subunit protein uS11 n=1 Tax=Candidatus Niyogibacteria bacterium CG10_big_fil_rev_8_21_14_0_10_42_19 TaxID=1974725 RepID=A0A2H0TFN5_9BACT|nr:MAG: 30S ribosomal protein S11 [Candidatus Niyogibacteria bacterium CG10_big_fil_rev_8_21_14_0_10_42_19]
MGKKRIAKGASAGLDNELKSRALAKISKKKLEKGRIYINSSYNNTVISLSDNKGDIYAWSSSGALGFKGARKGTPYAATKVAELISEKARLIGVKSLEVFVKGIGTGREAAIRSFIGGGILVDAIKDVTPIPHNGTRPRKVRRV